MILLSLFVITYLILRKYANIKQAPIWIFALALVLGIGVDMYLGIEYVFPKG